MFMSNGVIIASSVLLSTCMLLTYLVPTKGSNDNCSNILRSVMTAPSSSNAKYWSSIRSTVTFIYTSILASNVNVVSSNSWNNAYDMSLPSSASISSARTISYIYNNPLSSSLTYAITSTPTSSFLRTKSLRLRITSIILSLNLLNLLKYKGKNISEVLEMTVEESLTFFEEDSTLCKKIKSKIFALSEVGLQYVQLGQASNTLSGGEAQRIKLASFLSSSKSKQKKLFIFDEPTTGLHFHDVKKLIKALQDLVEMGHHVIIIEHHMDIIKSADWIIDLGPEGGSEGGTLLFEGNPDDFIKSDVLSYTKDFLKKCIEFKQPQIPQK